MPATASNRLDSADISAAEAVSVANIAMERGFRFDRKGNHAGPCQKCGGRDRFSISIRKGAFLCRQCFPKGGGGAIRLVMFLDDVGFCEAVETLIGRAAQVERIPLYLAPRTSDAYERGQHEKAGWLWSQRKPITGTIVEKYLREVRGIACTLPPTLGFLPPRKPDQHPAMIAAFGICDEVEPGIITAPRNVQAVHLTLLRDNGTKAEVEPNKVMIGTPSGKPIIVAPPSDLLGLAITEGIEDALSVHQAIDLGAWAAGAAGFMPKLADAVPGYIDSITVNAHADKAGQDGANMLAVKLRVRGIEVIIEGIDT
jgi:hypothetical protein